MERGLGAEWTEQHLSFTWCSCCSPPFIQQLLCSVFPSFVLLPAAKHTLYWDQASSWCYRGSNADGKKKQNLYFILYSLVVGASYLPDQTRRSLLFVSAYLCWQDTGHLIYSSRILILFLLGRSGVTMPPASGGACILSQFTSSGTITSRKKIAF